jgi:hypothetical protein
MQRYDFLERLIQQIAEAIARIAGLSRQGRSDEALVVVDQTYRGLGVDPEALRRLDSRSLAMLHGPPEKLRALARLCELEAEILEKLGRQSAARERWRRALELVLEADALDLSGADAEQLSRLAAQVDREALSERYRARLPEGP